MAIKVIAQRREVKLGKNPGKKFVMRPDLYIPIQEKKVTFPALDLPETSISSASIANLIDVFILTLYI